ncbi:hypothetical protein ES703_113352 [subsurface metagenome]
MSLVKIGSCNRCGQCCLSMKLGGPMLENPCIELHEDRCKFYVDQVNDQKYGHCLIYGRGRKPIGAVRDRYGNKITDAQIRWFNDNCIDYPSAEDLGAGRCPAECSFSFEAVIDG